jgi:hypothetical protein
MRTRIVRARGMQCSFLPRSRFRRLPPSAADDSLATPGPCPRTPVSPCTGPTSAPDESMHHAHARSGALTPSTWPTHEARSPPGGPLFLPPPLLPFHSPIEQQHQRLATARAGRGNSKPERAAAWLPARSTRRRSRRRRRRRSPARRSSPRPRAGRRR